MDMFLTLRLWLLLSAWSKVLIIVTDEPRDAADNEFRLRRNGLLTEVDGILIVFNICSADQIALAELGDTMILRLLSSSSSSSKGFGL